MTTRAKVLAALKSGYCNTSQDVADEVGITAEQASTHICALTRNRRITIKRTGRRMPNIAGIGRELRVFEVVNA